MANNGFKLEKSFSNGENYIFTLTLICIRMTTSP